MWIDWFAYCNAWSSFSNHPKEELKAYEVRLVEVRAGLNADFAQAMATRERSYEDRSRMQRTTWEMQSSHDPQN